MIWRDIVKEALINLGGEAYLKDIYNEVVKNNIDLPVNYEASIRDTLQRNSSDSKKYNQKVDLFYTVEGMGKGKWGLRDYEPEFKNMDITQDDT